ncbi:MAG TPA: glutamine amidotransferase [Pyrinomonadaceae bacterium]|nr:glutamine amidotransferase [Pyrinomonadaceae bacterium]
MGSLARLLFGHERAVFSNGHFGFDVRPRLWWIILLAILLGLFIYFVYIRPRFRVTRKKTFILASLRTALIALVIFMLLKPVVVVSSVVPRSSYVALAIDDSLSMNLQDTPARATRLDYAKQMLLAPSAGGKNSFLANLEEKFKTNLYGFSGEVNGVADGGTLYGEGRTTDISGALAEIAKRSSGMPLSAIVLASDGAANVSRDLDATLRELRALDVPVFTVGVGDTARPMDAELTRVNMPRRVLVGSRANIDAFVSLSGYGATRVLMNVREDGRAIKTEEFNLRGSDTQPVKLEVTPATTGFHRYTVEITPLEGEVTVENNKQDALVEVIEGPMRILHVEGEPRWELGKIRESLSLNEKNVMVVSLQRTGENKFYRQGIGAEQELVNGFPKTEEELFAYDGLVLGSVEASFFTTEQLRNIEAFVARRGGGLLALGGRLAFDAGRYKGTVIDDLLPLGLDGHKIDDADSYAAVYKPQLTAAGAEHPITRLNEDRAASQKTWTELPPVSISEAFKTVKPGAVLLLEAKRAGAGPAVPLLAQQRYGRGQTLALTATDTWRWRMRMDSKSVAHETFWRQMLRYLVSGTPRQIEVGAQQDVYVMEDTVRVVADIRDKHYQPVSDARASVRITKPSGATIDVPLKFTSIDDVNVYTGEFKADELGQHIVDLSASSSSLGQVTAKSNLLVSDINREFYSAAQNTDLLKRIAAETGGKYYQASDLQSLLDDLTYRKTPYSERVTKDLWDMPINFFLIVGLLSAEWFLRKREGLA